MSPCGLRLGSKLRAAAPFYVLGQCLHRCLGDLFALDPKHHGGLNGIFWTFKPPACDGLPDEILLLGGEVYLHM